MSNRENISIMLDPEDVNHLDNLVRDGKFANRSHAIRVAVKNLIKSIHNP